jgi:hypothetical protein
LKTWSKSVDGPSCHDTELAAHMSMDTIKSLSFQFVSRRTFRGLFCMVHRRHPSQSDRSCKCCPLRAVLAQQAGHRVAIGS